MLKERIAEVLARVASPFEGLYWRPPICYMDVLRQRSDRSAALEELRGVCDWCFRIRSNFTMIIVALASALIATMPSILDKALRLGIVWILISFAFWVLAAFTMRGTLSAITYYVDIVELWSRSEKED